MQRTLADTMGAVRSAAVRDESGTCFKPKTGIIPVCFGPRDTRSSLGRRRCGAPPPRDGVRRGLNFKDDKRLEFLAPGDRAEVRLPVTISWTVTDFELTGADGSNRRDAGSFGVYIDRTPQPPGEHQTWLVRNDTACKRDPSVCGQKDFLAQRDIHTTTETTFVIDRLPLPTGDAQRRREFHEVTVVLLNGRSERIGESAFIRQFEANRDVS